MGEKAKGYPEDWDSVRKLIPKNVRMNEIYAMEAEYLRAHPDSGYLTEIMALKDFPDYIDYLPQGSIARKVRIMGRVPEIGENIVNYITISREELRLFVDDTTELMLHKFREKGSIR